MLCDNCKDRDSVVKLVQMLEGGPKELHLCEKCAAEKGVETMAAAPAPQLAELLQKLQQQPLLGGSGARRDDRPEPRCGAVHLLPGQPR